MDGDAVKTAKLYNYFCLTLNTDSQILKGDLDMFINIHRIKKFLNLFWIH